jgi:hypothetical protein
MALEQMVKIANHPSFITMSQVDLSKQEKTKPQQLLETTMELNSIT